MIGLLTRVWVQPFYRKHTGVLILLLFAAFGAVQTHMLPAYHHALIDAFVFNTWGWLALFAFWSTWYVRSANVAVQLLRREEGFFLHHLRLLSFGKQLILFAAAMLQCLLPLFLYTAFMCRYLALSGRLLPAIALALFHAFALVASTSFICRRLNRASSSGRADRLPRRRTTSSSAFTFWPLLALWHGSRRNYVFVKAFSMLLLYVPLVWNRDRFDHDSLALFLIVLVAVNSWAAFHTVRFMEGPLRFYRNLPVGALSVWLIYVLTFSVFLLPEAAYLAWAGSALLPPAQLAAIWMVPLATLLFLAAVQYGNGTGRDEYLKVLGGLSFVSLFFFNGEYYARWAFLLLVIGTLVFFLTHRRFDDDETAGR